jgi:hypothetical protein
MRYILPFILSLGLLSTSGPALAQIKKEVSEITDTKRLVSKDMRNLVTKSYPGHGSFRAEYENPPSKDPIWQLSFFGFTDDTTKMSSVNTVRMTADGKTITPLQVKSRTQKLENSILEIKDVTFTRSAFEQIATAQKVAATIGPIRFEFTHPLRKDLRLILDRVPKGKGPQTASSDDSASSQ